MTHHNQRVSAKLPFLPDILRRSGFQTVAYTGGGFLGKSHGFGRGFDEYQALERKDLGKAVGLARQRIARFEPGERFFLFLHTYEVHCPYTPPSFYAAMFFTRPPEERIKAGGRCDDEYNAMSLTPGQAKHLSDLYDAGIRYADDLLKPLFEDLAKSPRREDTVVVLLSDHGEEFLEHGRIGHTDSLYLENLRIPWIMAGGGLPSSVVIGAAGLRDVMPTLLDLLGVEGPSGMQPSLLPRALGKRPEEKEGDDRPVYSENDWPGSLRSILRGRYHLVHREKSDRWSLFDWKADPQEQRNLAATAAGERRGLRAALDAHFRKLTAGKSRPERASLSEEEEAQLRALGYVE